MATTTFGSDTAMEAAPSTMNSLEQPHTPHLQEIFPMDALNQSDSSLDALPTPSRNVPPPNPPFVFPARPPASSAPSSYSRASGRRPGSALRTPDRSTFDGSDGDGDNNNRPAMSPALPNFSFNPGAAMEPDQTSSFLSPPMSPQSPRNIPSPSKPGGHGHRRGGSEFVGGNLRTGESITVMSTSPTKSDSGFASPTLQTPSANARRRGHAHRRSAAISSHDLTLILQPPKPSNPLRGSSAPASPADFGRRLEDSPITPDVPPLPALLHAAPAEAQVAHPTEQSLELTGDATPRPPKPATRARVGFSDTLEFIPRPLSLVSSDASSTATARPGGHSVSGSLSSIVSVPEPEPAATNEMERNEVLKEAPLSGPLPQSSDSRPSTAGAVLERTQSSQVADDSGSSPRRRNSIPHLSTVANQSVDVPPEPSPSKTPKRWSFFGLDPFVGSQAPAHSRPDSPGSIEAPLRIGEAEPANSGHVSDSALDAAASSAARQKIGPKKSKKKKKKVKAWAGSILKSKSRPRSKKSKEPSQAVPLDYHRAADEGAADGEPSEEPTSSPATPTVTVTHSSTSEASRETQHWKPRSSSSPEDDSSLAMIDLDAALGPFNTPLPHNPEWEAAQKAAGPTKRQLHSAQGLKGFSGPGMHYHRRAESAPEMVPFEPGRFGFHRFGSSSTMADVFEEDEEDEDEDDDDTRTTSSQPSKDTSRVSTGNTADSLSDEETPPALPAPKTSVFVPGVAQEDVGTERSRQASSMKSERSITSLHDQVIAEEPARIGAARDLTRHDPLDLTDSATPSPRRALGNTDLAPVDVSPLHLPTQSNLPVSPYSMSHSSSFPSPRSPMSYDAQRISTAPSSVADENNFQSLLLGEPGPEVRLSVDMPPSLTSSNSTMTRDSAFVPLGQPRPQMPFRPDQRPASVSSTAFGRRRSSLASLSRLISSSHGERSKLSMEVSCDIESDKKQKSSKTKRLSRLVQFWKPKGESTS